jgi:hypothetical protein
MSACSNRCVLDVQFEFAVHLFQGRTRCTYYQCQPPRKQLRTGAALTKLSLLHKSAYEFEVSCFRLEEGIGTMLLLKALIEAPWRIVESYDALKFLISPDGNPFEFVLSWGFMYPCAKYVSGPRDCGLDCNLEGSFSNVLDVGTAFVSRADESLVFILGSLLFMAAGMWMPSMFWGNHMKQLDSSVTVTDKTILVLI